MYIDLKKSNHPRFNIKSHRVAIVHMKNHNSPEMITIQDENFGCHAEHWALLTAQPEVDVPLWLKQALDQPYMPMGLCQDEAEMDARTWLIQGPKKAKVHLSQVIAVDDAQHPVAVKTAFPCFNSPYKFNAVIDRIIASESQSQAVLRLQLNADSVVYAFDNLYGVNRLQYNKDHSYQVSLNAWAYTLERVPEGEQIIVDDPASIKHHRALHDILQQHDGVAPDNLQELLAAWTPQTPDDEAPVAVDFSKMVAYLYGEKVGQEDEAWFQGNIVGKSDMQFQDSTYTLYDVTLIREDHLPSTLVRIATRDENLKNFEIGEYIRGNIWIQANIYDKNG